MLSKRLIDRITSECTHIIRNGDDTKTYPGKFIRISILEVCIFALKMMFSIMGVCSKKANILKCKGGFLNPLNLLCICNLQYENSLI